MKITINTRPGINNKNKVVPTLLQLAALSISHQVNVAFHSENTTTVKLISEQVLSLPVELASVILSYLSPLSLLKIEEKIENHYDYSTHRTWKKFHKRWRRLNIYLAGAKLKTSSWKQSYWSFVFRSSLSSQLVAFNNSHFINNNNNNNDNIENNENDEKKEKNENNEREEGKKEEKYKVEEWKMPREYVRDGLESSLYPPGLITSYKLPSRNWNIYDLLNLSSNFINEIRLFTNAVYLKQLPQMIESISNLESLSFSYAREAEPVLDILKVAPKINSITLEHILIKALPIWGTLIDQKVPLTSVILRNGNFGDELLNKFILQAPVKEIILEAASFGDDDSLAQGFFESLTKVTTLERLSLCEIDLDELGAIPYIASLVSLPFSNLVKLKLEDCMLYPGEISMVCKALHFNHSITHINFSDNVFETSGSSSLADMLLLNTSIIKLKLYHCTLGTTGMERIVDALTKSKIATSIKVLNLGQNYVSAVGDMWSRLLNHCCSLQKLSLESTQLGASGIQVDFLNSIRDHSSLSSLDLSANRLGDVGILPLVTTIAQNNNIQHLDISGNLITALGGTGIATTLQNKTLHSLNLNRNALGASVTNIQQLTQIKKLRMFHSADFKVVDGIQERL